MNKYFLKIATIATLLFLYGLTLNVRADDTDIYLNPNIPLLQEPEVMFLIDYRASTNANKCSNVSDMTAAGIELECSYSAAISQALMDTGAFATDNDVSLFDNLFAVMKVVTDGLEGVKIGFMMTHNHTNNCEGPVEASDFDSGDRCSNGGFIPFGFKSMQAGDANGAKADFLTAINKLADPQGGLSHPYQGREMMFEFFRYLTGQTVYNGHLGWTDYSTNATFNIDDPSDNGGPGGADSLSWDEATETGGGPSTQYVSPIVGACAKVYSINFVFGVTNTDADSDTALQAAKSSGGMGITLAGGTDDKFQQVVNFLNDEDLASTTYVNTDDLEGTQNVISYFFVPSPSTKENAWAAAGGTTSAIALSDDPDAVVEIITNIFESILSVSTTFVAPSVPVNVFNRSQTEDEVFLALFKANEAGLPFWPGNLRKLNIAPITLLDGTTSLELQDANGDPAIDTDGRLKLTALTEWTEQGGVDMVGAIEDEATDDHDGRAVERGGAGQQIPGYLPYDDATVTPGLLNGDTGARQLFYEDTSGDLQRLNADDTAGAALFDAITRDWSTAPSGTTYALSTTAEQDQVKNIIKYTRGLLFVTDADPVTAGDQPGDIKRFWMVGDPLHSRPLTINYGARTGYSTTNPDIRVFFGTNDGLFHMIKNTNTDGSDSGAEVWAYAPRELMPIWNTLYENLAVTNPIHPYSADGSATALVLDVDNDGTIETGDQVIVFVGLRRGGKSYYALDITDPDAPVLLWSISKYSNPLDPAASTINADFEELAQSWSKPVVGFKDFNNDGIREPVLVFGGGYNGDDAGDNLVDNDAGGDFQDDTGIGKDQANRDLNNVVDPISIGSDDETVNVFEGNAIFMVDALTGALIWKATGRSGSAFADATENADMLDSIPSEVSAVDTDGDALLDRIYVGDTGGRVWRADIQGTVLGEWQINILLDAGRHVVSTRANDRRFFNRPDIVQTAVGADAFDAILIGSGDRENPKGTDTEDVFFMIKDQGITSLADDVTTPATVNLLHPNADPDAGFNLADVTDNCLQDGSCLTPPDLTNGWFMELGLGSTGTGEKNLAPALVLGGIVFFSTFSPTSGACGLSEGSGKQFALNLFDATAAFNYNVANDGDSSYPEDRFDTIESGGIPVEAVPLGEDILLFQGQAGEETIQDTGAATSWKTYWYEQNP